MNNINNTNNTNEKEVSALEKFVKAMKEEKGFQFFTDYKKYSNLSKDELRNIAKELIYAIQKKTDVYDRSRIYNEVEDNLTELYKENY